MTQVSERCGAKHPKQNEHCTREVAHVGMHSNGGNVTWKQAKPPAAPAPEPCGDTMGGRVCGLPKRHTGDHAEGGSRWNRDHTSGSFDCSPERDGVDDEEDPLEDEIRSDDERDFARKMREDREAHAAELEQVDQEPEAPPTSSGTVFRNVTIGLRRRDLQVHPAADALPMIDGPEFESLVADIRGNGQRHPIVLDHTGTILIDGRNRMRACERLGIDPLYETLPADTNIAAYVISTNLKRRHLDASQRAAIASEIANLSQGQRKQTRHGAGVSDDGVTQAEAAAGAGVGERSVQRANAVHDKAVPELWSAVKAGKVDLKGAEEVAKLSPAQQRKLIKERIEPAKGPVKGGKIASLARQETKREVVRKINNGLVAPMPLGPFGVIYADYPWKYDNSDQHEGSRGHMNYPPMELDAIIAHAREAAKRAGDNCIVALWVTNLYIPHIGRVVEAYGAEHHTMLTWPKSHAGVGSWPRGQTEHLVIASIGKPVHTLNEISTLLPSWNPEHPKEHSSKPREVGELLLKHCAGPHLELFGRDQNRSGWTVWGAEVDKFATTEAA